MVAQENKALFFGLFLFVQDEQKNKVHQNKETKSNFAPLHLLILIGIYIF